MALPIRLSMVTKLGYVLSKHRVTCLRFCTFIYETAHNPYKQMAKSRYEYVKNFENDDKLLLNTWIVVRIDGRAFHKFTKAHDFQKPNDERALNLMNLAAITVMTEFKDIALSFGQSDEYSFVFRKNTELYNRRSQKIMSYVNSLFTSSYVLYWNKLFKDVSLKYPPFFDARVVLYPTDENLKDYLSWRQADVHVNNLYNTAFWNLVQHAGLTNQEAEQRLRGTFSADKNELLFSEFGINYNNEPAMYRKGTILLRKIIKESATAKTQHVIFPLHIDLIREKFWKEHDEILSGKPAKFFDWTTEMENLPDIVSTQMFSKESSSQKMENNT